jgi:hypothetical protein
MTTGADEEKTEEVHCHDCGMIASSPEEARANGFCHVKVFDARRLQLVSGGGDDMEEEEQAERLVVEVGYCWLCPDCFLHVRETLLVVGSDNLGDNFS